MRFLLKRFFILITFISSCWVLGFITFLILIPSPNKNISEIKKVDAIVILTGDYLRLEKGVEAFFNSDAKKILISGVHKHTPKKAVLRRIKQLVKKDVKPEELYLGNIANSTISNATEAKIFMDLNKYKSLNLVTSNYHIPRSLMLFKRAMPNYEISYTAAGLNKTELIKTKWRYLITEYHKLIGTIGLNFYTDVSDIYFKTIVYLSEKIKQTFPSLTK